MASEGVSKISSDGDSIREKQPVDHGTAHIDLETAGEKEGYVLDAAQLGNAELKTAKDGHTVLIPQPSSSPADPLNWSDFKKAVILIIISATAFLPGLWKCNGIWGMTEDEVNHSQVGNVFMLGAGGVFVVAFSAYFGRYPVLFWFLVIALATAVWCAAALSFESFMGGLMFIKDMFFFHEHARKINIWSSFIIVSPYMGPLLTAFIINTQKWQWAFGIYSIMTGLCLIAVILFVDESYYDRKIPADQQPQRGSRWKRMIGIEQWQSHLMKNTFKDAMMRPLIVISKPPVMVTMLYYLFTFAWVVGINTTLSIFLGPLYNFGPKQIGFFYFTPVVAAILGEIAGHWLHDMIARVSAQRNNGRFEPEARYVATWVSTPFLVSGIVLLGFALERGYHYMLASLGWGLYVFGIMITTVAVNAYALDSYPEASGEVAAWINFARTTGGFVVSYFMVEWAGKQGAIRQFGTMAGICGFAFVMIIFLQIFGKRMRMWAGPVNFKTV
ncbi:conserved hypothetical protein [Uncinocarpus reesii 1704]|uniref:Major facilitator superfamily (MFS) profile domain-containing protein n=1 Tax=Uncinocarpus reesii (strain UAMH 1704) TaxID=336963 RepID=C4JP53_UNCRE|nr:uncharacterized protein UREG_03112 [Uncinocarpus reesii 1704]EEP78267.1 conserved hypothetical protein [Uncinocarpus reesii 1704]